MSHIFGLGRQKQVAPKGSDVPPRRIPAAKRGSRDRQLVMFYGVEYSKPRIGAITRQQHDLNARIKASVKIQQLPYETKSLSGCERFILMRNLVRGIGIEPLLLVDAMTLAHVK